MGRHDTDRTGHGTRMGGQDDRTEGRQETTAQRLDRNWAELLQELRVAQTGAQILAAFLVTVPFQQRFTALTPLQRAFYLVTVTLAGLTTGLLVAPVAWHRVSFRQGERPRLVGIAQISAELGLLCLGVTVSAALALVFWVVLGPRAAAVAGVVALVALAGVWFVVPLFALRPRSRPRD